MPTEFTARAAAWALTYLAHSTLLLGVAWLVARRLTSPAARDLLWKAALAGGFLTATLQTALGGVPAGGTMALEWAGVEAHSTSRPSSAYGAPVAAPAAARRTSGSALIAAPVVLPDMVPAEAPGPMARAPQPLSGSRLLAMGLGLWLAGAVVLLALYLVQRARAFGRIGVRRPVTDAAMLSTLEQLRRAGGVRRPIRLTAAPGLSSPVALGGGEIAVPEAALSHLTPEQQRSMLAHELAHVVRGDPGWLMFACVVERLCFVQPLNRLARGRLQEAAEYLCDDWAVRSTGSGLNLAACLVKVAEWVEASPPTVPLSAMAERRSQLVSRIHRLLEGRAMNSTPRTVWFLGGVAALIGLTAVAAPGVTARTAPASPAPRSAAEAGPAADVAPAGAGLSELEAAIQDTGRVVTDSGTRSEWQRINAEMRRAQREAQRDAHRAMAEARAFGMAAPAAPTPPTAPMPAMAPPARMSYAVRADLARAERSLSIARGFSRGGDRQGDTTSIATPALVAALKDSDVQVRRAAVQSLSNLGDARAVPGLIDALRDSDDEVRTGAVEALAGLEDKRAVPGLTALLKDRSRDVRVAALSALGRFSEANVPAEAILSALDDSDAQVREAAMSLAMSRLGEQETKDARFVAPFTRLLGDPSPDIRMVAIAGLGQMGLTQAPAALMALAKDRNADVRQHVAEALGAIRDPRGVPTLKDLLSDVNADVREQAVSALGEIRDRSALEALVGALKSSDATVRRAAAQALGQREEE